MLRMEQRHTPLIKSLVPLQRTDINGLSVFFGLLLSSTSNFFLFPTT